MGTCGRGVRPIFIMESILYVLVLLFIVLIISFIINQKHSKVVNRLLQISKELAAEKDTLEKENDTLSRENEKLSVYKSALNADEEAAKRLEEAKIQAGAIIEKANDQAKNIVDNVHKELESITLQIEEAKKEKRKIVNESKEQAEVIKNDAVKQAANIVSDAERKAKEIAGEAYDIANKAKEYEEIATAMRNVIRGYGDEYLKPTFSLLDELADEFGFDDAGKKLKDAREHTRLLMKNDQASSCDYVELNRKITAKNFVLDAFNGKVDTILADIKKNNYGILERKMRDAYSLVNHLGSAFRNARINEIYLEARLEELKWAVAVNDLKIQEREEQRRIKEQIREEEKARREYEKALKDAEKEEETIRKAMEKARLAIEKASSEQKMKYEAQLAELQEKLAEAEAKNQRALSMAQQTKSGHVYIISNIGSFGEDVFKIGMTRRLEPLDRVRELGDASVPFPFDVHAMIYSEDAPKLETELHQFFVRNQVNKVNPRKEFFRVPIADIRKEIDNRGIEAKWTMMASALEYKETLAIEKAMKNNQKINDDWVQSQKDFAENFDDLEEEKE